MVPSPPQTPPQHIIDQKKVTWNRTPSDYNASNTRVLVEATPPELGIGQLRNSRILVEATPELRAYDEEQEEDESYMAELLADTQDLQSPIAQSEYQASQLPLQDADLSNETPVLLDTSLDLHESHPGELGPETQVARNSLERHGRLVLDSFGNDTTVESEASAGSAVLQPDISVHNRPSPGPGSIEVSLPHQSMFVTSPLPQLSNQMPSGDEGVEAASLLLSRVIEHTKSTFEPSPARLEISLEMGDIPTHHHLLGDPLQSTLASGPENLEIHRDSNESVFLTVEGDQSGRGSAIIQSTYPQDHFFASPRLPSPTRARSPRPCPADMPDASNAQPSSHHTPSNNSLLPSAKHLSPSRHTPDSHPLMSLGDQQTLLSGSSISYNTQMISKRNAVLGSSDEVSPSQHTSLFLNSFPRPHIPVSPSAASMRNNNHDASSLACKMGNRVESHDLPRDDDEAQVQDPEDLSVFLNLEQDQGSHDSHISHPKQSLNQESQSANDEVEESEIMPPPGKCLNSKVRPLAVVNKVRPFLM